RIFCSDATAVPALRLFRLQCVLGEWCRSLSFLSKDGVLDLDVWKNVVNFRTFRYQNVINHDILVIGLQPETRCVWVGSAIPVSSIRSMAVIQQIPDNLLLLSCDLQFLPILSCASQVSHHIAP